MDLAKKPASPTASATGTLKIAALHLEQALVDIQNVEKMGPSGVNPAAVARWQWAVAHILQAEPGWLKPPPGPGRDRTVECPKCKTDYLVVTSDKIIDPKRTISLDPKNPVVTCPTCQKRFDGLTGLGR